MVLRGPGLAHAWAALQARGVAQPDPIFSTSPTKARYPRYLAYLYLLIKRQNFNRIRLERFRSIRIRVRIFNIRYRIRIRILKSHIYDIDI